MGARNARAGEVLARRVRESWIDDDGSNQATGLDGDEALPLRDTLGGCRLGLIGGRVVQAPLPQRRIRSMEELRKLLEGVAGLERPNYGAARHAVVLLA